MLGKSKSTAKPNVGILPALEPLGRGRKELQGLLAKSFLLVCPYGIRLEAIARRLEAQNTFHFIAKGESVQCCPPEMGQFTYCL